MVRSFGASENLEYAYPYIGCLRINLLFRINMCQTEMRDAPLQFTNYIIFN